MYIEELYKVTKRITYHSDNYYPGCRDRRIVMNAGVLAIIFIGVLLIGLLFFGVFRLSEE
jgi:hypothetical protein